MLETTRLNAWAGDQVGGGVLDHPRGVAERPQGGVRSRGFIRRLAASRDLVDRHQAHQRLGLGARQLGEQERDAVAQLTVAGVAAHAHRHHRLEIDRCVAALGEEAAQAAGGRGQQHVVDRRVVIRLDLPEIVKRGRLSTLGGANGTIEWLSARAIRVMPAGTSRSRRGDRTRSKAARTTLSCSLTRSITARASSATGAGVDPASGAGRDSDAWSGAGSSKTVPSSTAAIPSTMQ
jgi:hypothetical protein